MSGKPVLHYFCGRGRAEAIRFMLAVANVEFEETFYRTKEEFDKLLKSGKLMYQQVPMLEIDGINLVQTKAILSYIAGKYDLYGSDLKERAYIDMYVDGSADLLTLVLSYFFLDQPGKEKQLKLMRDKAVDRYLPVFDKALKDKEFLVGNKLSMADVHVLDTILQVEEFHCDILQNFAQLQAFKKRMCEIPAIKKHLQPGSRRKPMADATYVETVTKLVFH
ncbi:glutathione S-transferase 3-like [Bufo gargarizans]|uniref:glutathione S-transferase 3-like n=1 Tax=Bufo gargarizans TaxID=30331 RepID=UPI001CF2ED3B|nr:glutathione S-transferase 3-like [Bufo gargarizans]XP_044146077.1 glutathione S-transferase 3-like [Bufo gargarizans]